MKAENVFGLCMLFLVIACAVAGVLGEKSVPLRTGTRSYYGTGRELLAYTHGEYLGDHFVPSMDIEARLRSNNNLERVVLVETIPD